MPLVGAFSVIVKTDGSFAALVRMCDSVTLTVPAPVRDESVPRALVPRQRVAHSDPSSRNPHSVSPRAGVLTQGNETVR